MLYDIPCGIHYLVQCTRRWMKRCTAFVVLTTFVSLLCWALHSHMGNRGVMKVDPGVNPVRAVHEAKHHEAFSLKPRRKTGDEDISPAHRKPSVDNYHTVPFQLTQNVGSKDTVLKLSPNVNNIRILHQKQVPIANNNGTAPMKLITNGKKGDNDSISVKVLLLAYFRTGSTFTAELLQQTEGAFYTFEPLHALYSYYTRKSLAPTLMNGTKWNRILEGYQIPYARHLLDSLLHCHISRIDKISVVAYSKKSIILSKFRSCNQKYKTSPKDFNNVCVRDLQEDCQRAPIRVIKTIRTPMRLVRELLEADPSLKVIHLLRDPRAHTRSWMQHDGEGGKPRDKIEAICNRIRADLETRYELQKLYPGAFNEIIYEALARQPMAVLKKVYSWLEVPIQQKVINWLINSTHSQKDGTFVETFRKNSAVTAYSWTKNVKFSHVNLVNTYCRDIIAHGQFPPLNTEQELREFKGIVSRFSESSLL
ncbi:carbohydrate sulfotransferase 1-like [Liolophura sinensis]|uniref:carbohydrate sulfotransferase 1-like n=1 Tax=Liolophura sinensis TaxID=3198878 RepID=UPI0031593347